MKVFVSEDFNMTVWTNPAERCLHARGVSLTTVSSQLLLHNNKALRLWSTVSLLRLTQCRTLPSDFYTASIKTEWAVFTGFTGVISKDLDVDVVVNEEGRYLWGNKPLTNHWTHPWCFLIISQSIHNKQEHMTWAKIKHVHIVLTLCTLIVLKGSDTSPQAPKKKQKMCMVSFPTALLSLVLMRSLDPCFHQFLPPKSFIFGLKNSLLDSFYHEENDRLFSNQNKEGFCQNAPKRYYLDVNSHK